MANNFWDNSDADNNANNANNWSLGNVPTGTDVAVLDATSTTNCTLSGNISCAGISVTAAYSGTLALGAYSWTTTGDMTFDGTGSVTNSNGCKLNCGGNFDHKDQGTWVTWAHLEMTGSAKTITGTAANILLHLTISDDTTLSSATTTKLSIARTLTVASGKQLTLDQDLYYSGSGGTVSLIAGTVSISVGKQLYSASAIIDVTGEISGAGTWYLWSGSTVRTMTGTSTPALMTVYRDATLAAGTYGSPSVTLSSSYNVSSLTFGTGTVIFTGAVTFIAQSANYTIANSTNNPDIEFQGAVALTETGAVIIWTAGSGTITLSGSTTVDFNGETVEDIDVDTAGMVTLTGSVTTGSLVITNGTLALGTNNVTTTGNFTVSAGTTVTGTGTITCGATFVCNGTSGVGNDVTFNGPDLDITTAGSASYTTATNSDASAGVAVDATDGTNTDGMGNVNWNFAAAAAVVIFRRRREGC